MHSISRIVYIKRIAYIVALFILVYAVWTIGYLIMEYVIRSHTYTPHKCDDQVSPHVPDYLHQIYYPIKSPDLSKRNRNKLQTWKDFHPGFKHVLWNETAVIELIKKDYPKLLPLYRSYGHWVQRIDVAKYVILYHYGGWYIDLDISCRGSLYSLAMEMIETNKSVVLHSEDTIGPGTDFIGVSPRHPFIKFVLDGLHSSNKWFLLQHTTIMFSTGPSFLWGRYLNYPCSDELLILSLKSFAQYARLSHDCSWWGNDTRFIYYALSHKLYMLTLLLTFLFISIVFCKRKRCIYTCMRDSFSRHTQKQAKP